MAHLLRCLSVCAALTACLAAQRIDLRVVGGSMPGQLEMSVAGGTPFQVGVILLSVTRGPTPLALLDPPDPRHLDVGLELAGLAVAGPFLAAGSVVGPTLAVPTMPAILDAALYFQAVSLPGSPRFVDSVSLPRAVRFAPAGAFRDRFAALQNSRSFCPVLPADDGRVLLAGGGAGALFAQVARKDTEWFDPMTDGYTTGPDLTAERSLHTATRLEDGRWLIVGGVDRLNDPQPTAEIWNPVAATFTATSPMATPRMGHAATLLQDGRVLVSGGITDLNAPNTPIDPIYSITRSTEIFDPTTGRWATGPQLRRPRAGHAIVPRADGRVLLCGGVSWTTLVLFRVPALESSTDLFDPTTDTIVAGPTLRHARAQCSTIEVAPGRWLLAGGIGAISLSQPGTPTAAAEIYDEASNGFAATGSLAQQRTLHAAFALGNGRVLHVGGGDGTLFAITPLASTEIYDLATGTFSAGLPLNQARAAFAAYETATGQIHVIGGEGPNGVDNSSEFFYR